MFLWFSGCHHAPTRTNTMAGSLLVLTRLLLGVIPSQTACMWEIGVLRCRHPSQTACMWGIGVLRCRHPSQTACMWGIGVLRCTALRKSIKQSSKRSKVVKQHTCHMATGYLGDYPPLNLTPFRQSLRMTINQGQLQVLQFLGTIHHIQ